MLGNVFASVVKAAASVVTKLQPYELKEAVHGYQGSLWTLHKGVAKDSGKAVSILTYDFKNNPSERQLAAIRNAAKRLKTLRHPGVVTFIDSYDADSTVYVIIEEVRPLSEVLEEYRSMDAREREANVAWGLYQVAKAVGFLNRDCKPALVHGNLSPSSIFVNRAGEWRLAGFELTCEQAEVDVAYRGMHALLDNRYKPPEITRDQWGALARAPAWAVDAYALGCIIYEAFNGPFTNPDELTSIGRIPQELAPFYKKLVSGTPASRPCTADITQSQFFAQPAVQVNEFLDSIAIRDEAEKEAFFRDLQGNAERLPKNTCLYKLLPSLITAMELMGPGATRVLPSVLKIAGQLPAAEFEGLMGAHLAKWYASADRGMRMGLLQGLPQYIGLCTMSLVADRIFPQVCAGFADPFPQLREATVKSLLHIGPRLPPRTLHQAVMKYFAKLQIDPEPGIRTNTTICLGRLAKYFTEAAHQRILAPAFTRTLRDPFAPARSAALASLAATVEVYNREECAQKVLPSVAPLCLDPEPDVRTAALACIHAFVRRLDGFVEEMNKEAAEAAAAQASADAKAPGGAAAGSSRMMSAAGSVLGWAASSLTRSSAPAAAAAAAAPEPAARTSPTPPAPTSASPAPPLARPSRLEAAAAAASDEPKPERKGGMRLGLGAVKAGGSGSAAKPAPPSSSSSSSFPEAEPRPSSRPSSFSKPSLASAAAAAADDGDADGWDADPWAAASASPASASARSPGGAAAKSKVSAVGAEDEDDASGWDAFEETLEIEPSPKASKPAPSSRLAAAAAAAGAAPEPPRPITGGMLLSGSKPAASASRPEIEPKPVGTFTSKPAAPAPAPAAPSAPAPSKPAGLGAMKLGGGATKKPAKDDWESLLNG